jgi:predicted TIM-barrel fold metal-dependent hydrolase
MARGKGRPTQAAGIIDTHVFVISPVFLRQNFLPGEIDATLDALVQDMDRAGVDRAIGTMFVTHEDDLVGSVPAGLARHRRRVAAQIHIQPNRAAWSAENVRAAAQDPSIVGARAMLSVFRMRPDDERLARTFQACDDAGLPVQLVFDASTFSNPDAFAALADAFPELPLVLGVTRARNRAALKRLLRYPRVFAQLPGLLDAETATGQATLLKWAARNLPAEKVMFGSDRFGRESHYAEKVRALRLLPPAARRWVERDTALSVYGERLDRALGHVP